MSGAIVAGVVVAAGAAYAANESSKASKDATNAQREGTALSITQQEKNLAFQQEQYDSYMSDVSDLEDIFGPIQDNLAQYYANISPEMYQLQGKEAIQNQYETTKKNLDAVYSNNGMFNSGQKLGADLALEGEREVALGNNRQNALNQYNQQEMQWLEYGTNQINTTKSFAQNAAAGVGNTYSGMASTYSSNGSNLADINMQESAGWGQFGSGLLQVGGYLASDIGGTK